MRLRTQMRRRTGGEAAPVVQVEVAPVVRRRHRVHGEDVETSRWRRGDVAVGVGATAAHAISPAVPEGVEGVRAQGSVAVGQTGRGIYFSVRRIFEFGGRWMQSRGRERDPRYLSSANILGVLFVKG